MITTNDLYKIGRLKFAMVYLMSTSGTTSLTRESLLGTVANRDFIDLVSSQMAFPGSRGKGLPILRVSTSLFTAHIALQGAQLLSFQAKGGKPLLWTSPNCGFSPGVALRGGIPVCLPWFGPHPTNPKLPKHGFARNRDWQLTNAHCSPSGEAELVFDFDSPADELFAYSFSARLTMTLGSSIKLNLSITNTDTHSFDCSWALHSYYPVSSLNEVRVLGLSGKIYLDNLEQHAVKNQYGDVDFHAEVDRAFPDINNDIRISGSPQIQIEHHNCPSVIVWNPGHINAAKIVDIGAGREQEYICVERGAVLSEKWTLTANETRSAWMKIKAI